MDGEVSIEQAILVGIVVVIAVAVGWYMYTLFLASIQSGSKISVTQAAVNSTGYLQLIVANIGPSAATIVGAYIGEVPCLPESASGSATISGTKITLNVGGSATLVFYCNGFSGTAGTAVQGYVVLSTGAVFPFTASVT